MLTEEGVTDQDDEGRLVTFFSKPVYQAAESEREGRPIYKSIDFVRIVLPNDNKTVIEHKVRETDKAIWPRWWQLHQAGKSGVVNGTPLEDMSFMPRHRAMELRAQQIFTVEQLRDVADDKLLHYGPDTKMLRDKAKEMLDPSANMEKQLRSENQELRQRLAEIESRMEQMRHMPTDSAESSAEQEAAPEPAAKRGPGRPRKEHRAA